MHASGRIYPVESSEWASEARPVSGYSSVWRFCGATNTKKLERIQFRALRFVFLDFESDYDTLLDRAGLPTLETI